MIDNFDYSETYTAIFQDESGDIDTEPSYSCDAELDGELMGKALSSDKRSFRKLTGIAESRRTEIDHTKTGCEQCRRDQLLHQEELSEKSGSS